MNVVLGGGWLQRLRLASGLVLFTFAGTHFLNHALGLVSLEWMHDVQSLRTTVTRSIPGSMLLGAALATHLSLGLHRLYRRRTLRLPAWEALQIAVALAIPFLLFPHIVNTRVAHAVYGVTDSYSYELTRLYPEKAVLQSLLLLLVWTHGCIGLHYWLRLTKGYAAVRPLLGAAAVAVPVLALAGFIAAGRLNAEIMSDPASLAALKQRAHWPADPAADAMAWMRDLSQYAFAALLAVGATLALMRWSRSEEGRIVTVSYAGGGRTELSDGMTVLEGSRRAGISHGSTCGGRARCFTCRIRVDRGLEHLPPPKPAESVALRVLEAPANIRLACQLRPTASLSVAVLNRRSMAGSAADEFIEIKSVTAAHARAVLSGEVVDFAEADPLRLAHWLAGRLPYQPPVPDFTEAGLSLAGGRIDFLQDRPVAAVVFERGDQPVTLHVLPAGETPGFAVRGSRHGYHVVGWADRGFVFYATSLVDSAVLDSLQGGGDLKRRELLSPAPPVPIGAPQGQASLAAETVS